MGQAEATARANEFVARRQSHFHAVRQNVLKLYAAA